MIARADSRRPFEWEANDFAAELLMPASRFRQDMNGRDPTFHDVIMLAGPEMYDVSFTAAALRYIELTSETCALVCAEDDKIKWIAKSDAFRHRLPWRSDSVPVGSIAHSVFHGEQPNHAAEPLEPHVWIETGKSPGLEMFESTLAIPTQNQVLSLIWVIAEDADYDA